VLTTDKFISHRSVLIGAMLLTSIIVTGEGYSASVSADELAEREQAAKKVKQPMNVPLKKRF
jgi:fructose-bisphosphate aldolase class 1